MIVFQAISRYINNVKLMRVTKMRQLLWTFICLSSLVFAEPSTPNETSTNIEAYKMAYANADSSKNLFDITEAYHIFYQTNLRLSTQNLDIREMNHAIKLFKQLNENAAECIESTQKRINNINSLMFFFIKLS